MRFQPILISACSLSLALTATLGAQTATAPDTAPDFVRTLVGRLDLDHYKNTIKGLAQFGDRRQGTKRNRDAIDWIEAQLKSYGCQNVERITYMFTPRQTGGNRAGGAGGAAGAARGGGGGRGATSPNGRGRAGNG